MIPDVEGDVAYLEVSFLPPEHFLVGWGKLSEPVS
jgi:hypothetical protein